MAQRSTTTPTITTSCLTPPPPPPPPQLPPPPPSPAPQPAARLPCPTAHTRGSQPLSAPAVPRWETPPHTVRHGLSVDVCLALLSWNPSVSLFARRNFSAWAIGVTIPGMLRYRLDGPREAIHPHAPISWLQCVALLGVVVTFFPSPYPVWILTHSERGSDRECPLQWVSTCWSDAMLCCPMSVSKCIVFVCMCRKVERKNHVKDGKREKCGGDRKRKQMCACTCACQRFCQQFLLEITQPIPMSWCKLWQCCHKSIINIYRLFCVGRLMIPTCSWRRIWSIWTWRWGTQLGKWTSLIVAYGFFHFFCWFVLFPVLFSFFPAFRQSFLPSFSPFHTNPINCVNNWPL